MPEEKGIINRRTPKKPKPIYNHAIKYDFLTYSRLVFRWALENNPDINRSKLELILYLYGKGLFTRDDYQEYYKTLSLFWQVGFQTMLKTGWIKLKYKKKKGMYRTNIYTLTHKAKRLCADMHSYCVGEKEIPTNMRYNKLADSRKKRINSYFMDAIKRMSSHKDNPSQE